MGIRGKGCCPDSSLKAQCYLLGIYVGFKLVIYILFKILITLLTLLYWMNHRILGIVLVGALRANSPNNTNNMPLILLRLPVTFWFFVTYISMVCNNPPAVVMSFCTAIQKMNHLWRSWLDTVLTSCYVDVRVEGGSVLRQLYLSYSLSFKL